MASSLALLALCAAVAVAAARPSTSGNMNGKYSIASGDDQDVPYNDDYASKGYEYFDVWSPELATQYSEVFWTDQGNQPLPPAIVERFKGKVLAIMGYEQDQVMVTPVGKPGVNPTEDVSVPINWAYNHHYMAWMTGQYSERVKVAVDPNDVSAHGAPTKFITRDLPNARFRANPKVPTSQMFSEGNGGESRKSYHGYPSGFAQLIESPTTWHITPMQIDTRNRECGVGPVSLHNCSRFTPGPEPRQARYGRGIPIGTNYSGILECPCNSRFGGDPAIYNESVTKSVVHDYSAIPSGTCAAGEGMVSAPTCFTSVLSLGVNATSFVNRTVSDATLPPGCTVDVSPAGIATVTFNTAKSTAQCGASQERAGQAAGSAGVTLAVSLKATAFGGFKRSPKGQWCSDNKVDVIKSFVMANGTAAAAGSALGACEAFCKTAETCWGCSVDLINPSKGIAQWSAIPRCGSINHFAGIVAGDISQKEFNGTATITVTGPAAGWFGVGFNAQFMSDSPYTLVFNSTGVMERKIGTCGSEAEHCPGTLLAPSVKVVATSVLNGMRTFVVTRPMQGATKDHYSFSLKGDATIGFISAIGYSQEFARHEAHSADHITFLTVGTPTCLCDLGAQGKLCDNNGAECESFVKSCVAAPAGDLLAQRNPTCNSRQYSGGLRCCHHQRIMLDADQVVPTELLRYHMKFRFWFQEFKPATPTTNASHLNLERVYQQTEANAGEYDIPPAFRRPTEVIPGYDQWPLNTPTPGTTCTGTCPDGPDCACVHTIKYTWTVSNIRLIYISGHCHAPACISMELYHNLTGTPELLCRQSPKLGKGNIHDDKYDEAGYIAIPPCLFDDEGLHNSTWLPEGTQLIAIKKNHNTHVGHFGEMASWQMRAVTA